MSTTIPSALAFMTDEYIRIDGGFEIVETIKGNSTAREWHDAHIDALVLRWQTKPPLAISMYGLVHKHLGLPPPGMLETTYIVPMTPIKWRRTHIEAVQNSFASYPPQ